jgi:hypothetical protein
MRSFFLVLVVFIGFVFSPAIALSEETDNWQFDLAPFYLWAISIDGDMGIRGTTASASVDFNDIWDNLQGVVTARFNAMYREKYGFFVDYNYLDIGKESAKNALNTEVSFKSQLLNLGGTYRLMDGRHTLDGLAGIRYTNLDAEINLRNIGVSLDGDQDWVDPIVGLRYDYSFSDKWSLRLYGDIGGFGVSSDFTWQGLGLIDYQPWKHVAFVAGYRAIGTDYETGSDADKFTYDNTVHGPVIGLDIRW